MSINNIATAQRFSLQPNKLALTTMVYRRVSWNNLTKSTIQDFRYEEKTYSDNSGGYYKPANSGGFRNPIVRKFHNFEISDNAYRSLKSKINWLYYYAKPRYVKTYSGKEIFNFKMGFITLTLPSQQKTPTIDITQRFFNQFLTEVKQRTDMQNYVWRLEFQKNGNVHYHIVTDVYLDYWFLLKIWNRILSKDSYISDYQYKHQNLSLQLYNKKYNSNKKTDFSVIAKRFAKGCSSSWLHPNTVDVKSVRSGKMIAYYIAKYFGKKPNGKSFCNVLDNKENSKSLRLWFCSRSLSKLKSISDFCEAVDASIYSILENSKKVRIYYARWAKMVYFDLRDFSQKIQKYYHLIFKDYAKKQGYIGAY